MRRKWSWTTEQERRAAEVVEVVESLKPYWPLTLRQIYYRLVAAGKIANTRSRYNMLSKLVKWMRIDDRLSWDALEDRSRRVTDKKGFASVDDFIEQEMEWMFDGYSRCLVQGQAKHIEVWVEKDALAGIFENVVYPYCIRAVVCRGYQSVTFLADFYNRAEQAMMNGQDVVVLYFGDLDPSGVQMLEASIQTLEDELDLYDVEFKRVGLNPEHIEQYNLPSDPEAAKLSDPRYRKYALRYGHVAVELDAVHPSDLEGMIRNSIVNELDMEDFQAQRIQEQEDIAVVRTLRREVTEVVQDKLSGMFG